MKIFGLFFMFTIIAFAMNSRKLIACHEGAMGGELGIGPTLRGHKPSTRVNGLLVITESTTAATSTTTSCDAYTGYLEKNYDQIAENLAKGNGIFLDSLTSFYGCPPESKDRFKKLFREHYRNLFINQEKNGRALGLRIENVLKQEKRFTTECSNLG